MAEVKVTIEEPTITNEIEEIPIRVFAAKGDPGQDGEDGFSPTVETSKTGRTTTITITDVNGEHTATILDGADGTGSGDMSKATYDQNNSGVVDNAEKVNDHTVEDDVPSGFFSGSSTSSYEGTSITLANAIRLKSVGLKGDTYQQICTGKNIFKAVSRAASSGITTTVNSNNSITVSGTATASGVNLTASFYIPSSVPAGTSFTLSFANTAPCTVRAYLGGGWAQVTSGNKSATATTTTNGTYVYLGAIMTSGTNYNFTLNDIQVEINSTATSYEPFSGGAPAPAPDYPQTVQAVTGTQTIAVRENLNLFDQSTVAAGDIRGLSPTTRLCSKQALWLTAGTYTISTNAPSPLRYAVTVNTVGSPFLATYPSYVLDSGWKNSASYTFTTNRDGWVVVLFSKDNNATLTVDDVQAYQWQIEIGETATSYQPYRLNTYTVNLGTTELCKMGDYQDYIYKSGDDWYIHKATAKATLGNLTWSYSDTSTSNVYRMYTSGLSGVYVPPANNATLPIFKCTHFSATTANDSYSRTVGVASNAGGTAVYIYSPDYTTTSSPASFKTWLTDNNVALYYALKTNTETKITDTTLIGQLEALAGASISNGSAMKADGTLPAILTVEALINSRNGIIEAIGLGGTTYTAGTGIDITNGVISCTFADGDTEEY